MKPILSNLSSPAISDPQTHASFTTTKPSFSTHYSWINLKVYFSLPFPPVPEQWKKTHLVKSCRPTSNFFVWFWRPFTGETAGRCGKILAVLLQILEISVRYSQHFMQNLFEHLDSISKSVATIMFLMIFDGIDFSLCNWSLHTINIRKDIENKVKIHYPVF